MPEDKVEPVQVAAEVQETPLVEPKTEPEAKEKFDEARAMALINKLREENKNLTKSAKRADELELAEQKRKEAEMTELEKVQKRAAELEATLKARELAILRRDVADKVGLPAVFVDRLKGETPEELEADAKAIIEALPKAEKPKISPTNPGGGATGETPAQALARIHQSGVNIFDPGAAKQMGGGTFINQK